MPDGRAFAGTGVDTCGCCQAVCHSLFPILSGASHSNGFHVCAAFQFVSFTIFNYFVSLFFLGHAISRSSLQLSVFKLSHWKIDPPNNSRLTVINQRLMNIVMQTSVSPDKCFCSRAKFID